ncbi:ribosome maturation factor RimP [bacterium]|nr:ribosome maturation factor RimP [bacterium]
MSEDLEGLLAAESSREGFELYSWHLRPAGRRRVLQVVLYAPSGVGLDDCARVSRRLGAALEAADAVTGSYVLEVSSPGLDRPLLTPRHYELALGERIRVTRAEAGLAAGENPVLEGVLSAVDAEGIGLAGASPRRLDWTAIGKARVLPDLGARREPAATPMEEEQDDD